MHRAPCHVDTTGYRRRTDPEQGLESLMRPLAAIFAIATARMPPAVIGRVDATVAVEDASSAACALRRGMRDCSSMTHGR